MKGKRTKEPIKVLIPMNVKGCTDSIPTLWETNEMPQIIAVRKSIATPFPDVLIDLFSMMDKDYSTNLD